MSDIITGQGLNLQYNTDTGNRSPQGVGNVTINEVNTFPVLTIKSELNTFETYNSEYKTVLLADGAVEPFQIVVNYLPDDTTHQFLDTAAEDQTFFQMIIQYDLNMDESTITYAIVNGYITSTALSGDKDSVVTKSYTFHAEAVAARMMTTAALLPVYQGDYGVGSNTTDVPQYAPTVPTGNSFIKVPSTQAGNPAGADMMGVGLVDGTSVVEFAMTKTGTLSLFAKNATTAWTRIYTATQMDARYVQQTRTINGHALSSNVVLDSADTGSLAIENNLSDLDDAEVARTNLDVYSKSETVSVTDSVQTNLDAYITSNNEVIDSINTTIIVNKNQVDELSDTVDSINSNVSDLVDVVNANKTQVDNYITSNNENIDIINSTISNNKSQLDQLSDSVDTRFGNVVLKTTTVNGKPLTGNITLTKSDVALGNVTNDAQLKIASNLSDLDNITTARSNLQLERYRQGTTETSILSANGKYAFRLFDNGLWGNYDLENGVYIPLSVDSGGTGGKTLEEARTNLGVSALESASTYSFLYSPDRSYRFVVGNNGTFIAQTGAGNNVPFIVGSGGTGASTPATASLNLNYYGNFGTAFNDTTGNMDSLTGPGNTSGGATYTIAIPTGENNVANWPTNPNNSSRAYGWGSLLCFNHGSSSGRTQIYVPDDATNLYFRHRYGSTWKSWVAVWTNSNTTVDSNGFIKKASPIVKLYSDGSSVLNDESEGVTSERIDIGIYHVYGTKGLNTDGWTIEIPQDINGNRLCFVSTDYDEEKGVLVINTYTRKFDYETAMIVAGEAIDIPADRWIDLRVEMSVDSIWNLKQKDNEQGYQDNE